jgi:hypothetical protein
VTPTSANLARNWSTTSSAARIRSLAVITMTPYLHAECSLSPHSVSQCR